MRTDPRGNMDMSVTVIVSCFRRTTKAKLSRVLCPQHVEKMSKKGPKSTKEGSQTVSYEIRDIVLGKVRGFPPWPGMVSCKSRIAQPFAKGLLFNAKFNHQQIVDPENVPEAVKSEAPAPRKTTFHCVQFFPTGD